MSQLGLPHPQPSPDPSTGQKGRVGRGWLWAASLVQAIGLFPTAWAADPGPSAGTLTPLAAAPWVRFLGWSADGRRVAWRSGTTGQFNVPGQPCDIARVNAAGQLVDRTHIASEITAALVARRIHSVPLSDQQQVTARDALVRDRAGHLWAGLVRDNLAAILYKRTRHYQPLWKTALPAPSAAVTLAGFESPAGDLIALVLEARMGRTSAATLLILPTTLDLPEAVSPTDDLQAGATP